MPSEQEATLSGLQTAIQMEIDGKQFYLKAGKASQNEPGAKLFMTLAAEEDIHLQVFTDIYSKIKDNKQWSIGKISTHGSQKLQTVFKTALETFGQGYTPAKVELDAVKTGMNMENKTLDFYRNRSAKAAFNTEKQLYDSIAMQESEHFRLLQDYYEFLTNPADYFNKKEHLSVDGG
jgi:rubrerythrin